MSLIPALVIQDFMPESTYESPSRTARACIDATSEPAPGSDRQYEPWLSPDAMRGTYFRFSSSEPQLRIGIVARREIKMVSAVDAQTRASSSTMTAWVVLSAPEPPYSTGMPRAGSSMARQSAKFSHEYVAVRSSSAARGAILFSAN